MATKLGIVLFAIFLTTYADEVRQPVKVLNLNECALKYRKDVPDRPDIFINTVIVPGVCRLQKHQYQSHENYETFKIEYYRKENEYEYGNIERGPVIPSTIQKYSLTSYQGLNYDVRTKTLIYVERDFVNGNYSDKLVRRRFNDSQLIEKVALADRYPHLRLKNREMDDLAYDWRTKNLYINQGKSIVVINVNKPWKPVNVVNGTSPILSLAIHPNAGYLFYVEMVATDKTYTPYSPIDGLPETYRGEYQTTIYRTFLDGSNKRQIGPIITHREAFIDSLVIDYHTDRLYWSIPHMSLVQSSNLDGTDVKDVIHQKLHFGLTEDSPRSISFDKKYVYYILKNKTVHRMDKETLKEDVDFEIFNEGEGSIYNMVVYDPESRKITTDHPCLVDNGGCEQYCLAWPKDQSHQGLPRTCGGSNL